MTKQAVEFTKHIRGYTPKTALDKIEFAKTSIVKAISQLGKAYFHPTFDVLKPEYKDNLLKVVADLRKIKDQL